MSSAESPLCLLENIVRSVERLCGGVFCCLGHRRKVSALRFLYKIYHRVEYPMNEHLNHFIAARNTRASVAPGELSMAIPRCKSAYCCSSVEYAAVGCI